VTKVEGDSAMMPEQLRAELDRRYADWERAHARSERANSQRAEAVAERARETELVRWGEKPPAGSAAWVRNAGEIKAQMQMMANYPIALSAWAQWEGAAQRFEGIGPELEAQLELRNIRLYECGYEVVIRRGSTKLQRCFRGFSEKTLNRAKKWRDEMLQLTAPRRKNGIPGEVLRKLGLSEPVVGVYRLASRSSYRINYTTADGRRTMKAFYYRCVPEEDAYAAAIAFLREVRANRAR
jgi:hypothetical protein